MRDDVHRTLLRVFRRLPTRTRRLIVRVASPSFTVGAVVFIVRPDGALLPQGQDHGAKTTAVLHVGRGAVAPAVSVLR